MDAAHSQVSSEDVDIVAAATARARAARSVREAFENTAQALKQFGIERIRVRGLSQDCTTSTTHDDGHDNDDDDDDDGAETVCDDGVREISEQQFMREFVFHSRPCIILGAVADWPAMTKWREDRYLFDLDHHLPSEEEVSSTDDDDDEAEEEGEEEEEEEDEAPPEVKAKAPHVASGPRPRGPKRITVALTPNGRADAVTHVLYSTADVPVELHGEVFDSEQTKKEAVLLSEHVGLADGDVMNSTSVGDDDKTGATKTTGRLMGEKLFMYAAEVKVTLPELYSLLKQSPSEPLPQPDSIDMRTYKAPEHGPVVAYAQLQNNCLNTEYQHLHADLRRNVEKFGNRVFGGVPEAANVWFGIPTSVSSMHQDWVENLYPVIRGVKEFTLLPPWEGVYVPKPEIPSAAFAIDEARSDRQALRFFFKSYPLKDGTLVPWMDIDFTPEQVESDDGAACVLKVLNDTIDDNESRKPHCSNAATTATTAEAETETVRYADKKPKAVHPIVAHVFPGETLYLPSMWLHRVSQRADEVDIRARAKSKIHALGKKSSAAAGEGETHGAGEAVSAPPLPLIAAVNYWYDMSFTNPAVVMLREFGLLL